MFITTNGCNNIKLPNNSGIVDKNNWKYYFSPFSSRAYVYSENVPDLNTASCTHLQIIDQISEKKADIVIIEERKKETQGFI